MTYFSKLPKGIESCRSGGGTNASPLLKVKLNTT